MSQSRQLKPLLPLLLLAAVVGSAAGQAPHLRAHGSSTQLLVDGRPMLILGGELGNSSASDAAYLASIWSRLQAAGLNTVLAPVYWELVEPTEGQFDFSTVDSLLDGARAHDLRLVLLWFGSWKNSMSSYAPSWVKRDTDRFPRARTADGTPLEILSPFAEHNVAADARAFARLMGHLSDVDGDRHTVVMVQVENEIGMIPEARDRSADAENAWNGDVPQALLEALATHRASLHPELATLWAAEGYRISGSWSDVFGETVETEELFMAWHFARYVEWVASEGKARHLLPMYVNAALIRPGRVAGEYPSAGPLPHLVDAWRAGAPSVDFLAPDIYFPNFVEWSSAYRLPGNPVFIPEAGYAGAPTAVADALYAFGALDALGFSPFSIEDLPGDDPLGQAYQALASLADLILQLQGTDRIAGVRPPVAFDGSVDESPQRLTLGDFVLNVSFVDPWTPRDAQHPETHGALILGLSDDTYLVVGTGVTLTFEPRDAADGVAGIDRAEAGHVVHGEWQTTRVLNGDQTHQGRHVRLAPGPVTMQRVRLYTYR